MRKHTREEIQVHRTEAWEQIMADLEAPMRVIYEQSSEIRDNMIHVARLAGSRPALEEAMDCLRAIDEATKDAKRVAVIQAAARKIPDTDIARRLDVHRHTVRRWREEHDQWERERSLATEEDMARSDDDDPDEFIVSVNP